MLTRMWLAGAANSKQCLPTAVTGARRFWLGLLHRRYPNLEFVRDVTERTATDTMRNQGIITLLLTVNGTFEPKVIKERLQVIYALHRLPCYGHITSSRRAGVAGRKQIYTTPIPASVYYKGKGHQRTDHEGPEGSSRGIALLFCFT